jgi:hypothetical protein
MGTKLVTQLSPKSLLQMARKGVGHSKLEEIAKKLQKKVKKGLDN